MDELNISAQEVSSKKPGSKNPIQCPHLKRGAGVGTINLKKADGGPEFLNEFPFGFKPLD
jgi:hypothetical protein